MAIGYRVTLGDGFLDTGDTISASQSNFTISGGAIGSGSWVWSGVYGGTTYTNIPDTGTYFLGTDGFVYFQPTNYYTTSGTGTVQSHPQYPPSDGTISGTTGNDLINEDYLGDPQRDKVTRGNDTINAGDGNDTVQASDGNDRIDGGAGNDVLDGEGGNDSIIGGSGNDVIHGDNITTPDRIAFKWSDMPDPQDSSAIDAGDSLVSGTTMNVGGINVTYTYTANPTGTTDGVGGTDTAPLFNGAATNVAGINDGASTANANSSALFGGDLATSQIALSFDIPVTNISFNINDIDYVANAFRDSATVRAYDANNNLIPVSITFGSALSASNTDTMAGNDRGTSTTLGTSGTDPAVTMGVSIAGPVSRIEIIYQDTLTTGDDGLIEVTDIWFDEPASSVGNDTIDAGSGDDIVYGDGGNDSIQGGTGTDSLYGGDGNDIINDSGTTTDYIYGGAGNDVISAGAGNDTVQGGDGADTIYGGDGADSIDGGTGNDSLFGGTGNDLLNGNSGDDSIVGELGDDIIYGGTGNDYVDGDAGNDALFGGDGNDVVVADAGNDTLFGGLGDDGLYASDGNNTASGDAGNDSLFMGTGNDTLFGGTGNDTLSGGAGNDTLSGDAGNDSIVGGAGSDRIMLADGFGVDNIRGDEDVGNTDTDILDASSLTSNVTVTMSGPEAGTLSSGSHTATFIEIEQIVTGSGDDSITGSAGNDHITTGAGADRINGGAGNDTINIGTTTPDGAADIIVFANGGGNDRISNFDAPTPNGNGTFTGIDTFDVSGLNDAQGNPVNTNDVTVSNDGNGNALLTFPNGETLTLVGISPVAADNPFYLNAIGIPLPDGTVSGTSGDDLIDASYTGDNDGDVVDGNDAILAGDTGNDDLIEAGAGNDSILAGSGNDEIYGGADNDTIDGGTGNDTLFGDAGNDRLLDGAGNDTFYGGTGNDSFTFNDLADSETVFGGENSGDNDTLDFSGNATDGVRVNFTGAESGRFGLSSVSFPPNLFAEIETYVGTDFNDTFNAGLDTAGVTILAGAGNDDITGGTGDDSIAGGTGQDFIVIRDDFGNDTIDGGSGGETSSQGDHLVGANLSQNVTLTYTGAESGTISNGTDTLNFSEIELVSIGTGDDIIISNADSHTVYAGSGADTISAGDGNDVIYLGGFNGDGDADVVVLTNGTYTTRLIDLDLPVAASGGLFTGTDTLDVSTLLDANGDPVNTNDVTVANLGSGGVRLTFPLGEQVILEGVTYLDAINPFYLNALGIPLPDGTVSGTAGDDLIDGSYIGDTDGDIVDNNDAILPGDTGNDDLIEAGAGNDSILAGNGNDEIYGGTGNDTIDAGFGDDTMFGEAGNDVFYDENLDDFSVDTMYGGTGNDTFLIDALDVGSSEVIVGGENTGDNDTVDFSGSASESVWVTFTGAEAGTFTDPIGTATSTFAEIETFVGTDYNDVFNATAETSGVTILSGAGTDVIIGGTGDDSIAAGDGDDSILILDDFGNDTIDGGANGQTSGDTLNGGSLTQNVTLTYTGAESGTINNGAQTLTFSEIESVGLGAGDDTIIGTADNLTINAGAGADTISAGDGVNFVNLGSGGTDGDADVVVLVNGTYTTIVQDIDLPVAAGGGLFTGTDTLDVTGLLDANGDPVNTNDVTITDLGGSVELTFPLGETVVLAGVTFANASNPFYLNALGIPLPDGTVEGTAGDDVITAGYTGDPDGDRVDNDDAILPGDTGNDDLIYAYGGNDTVNAGYGDDEVYGGDGDDFLLPGSGEDTIFGGAGNDTIAASFGADTIFGGDGNDTINGGGWDNEVDILHGDAGDDSISGDLGNDILYGGADNDTLFGGPGDDQLYGGTGDDTLTGGTGADTLSAGAGNDILNVAEGDTATGGDGDDLFILDDLGETGDIIIDGSSGVETDGDTLNLNGLATVADVMAVATNDGTGSYSGTVTLSNGATLTFSEIENIICFTPGTKIATPQGARDIATLRVGDLVVTRDHGLQPIRWIQQRTVPAKGRFAPVRIRPGVVTGQESDLIVSPQHRMLFQGYRAELLFGQSEVLIAATHLIDGTHVTQDEGGDVTYIHMMFDEHEVVFAEGAATESFHPGEIGLSAVSDSAREELFAIFPELRADVSNYGPTARRCLKRHEAELVRNH